MVWTRVCFADLLVESRDGEWGEGIETLGHQRCAVVRGTDFADLNSPGIELPKRWIPDHLVARKKLQPGDIVFEMAGGTAKQSTGRSALLTQAFFDAHEAMPVLCASFCRHLRLDGNKYDPAFIYYLLQALYGAGYMAVFNIQHTGVSRFQYTSFKKQTVLNVPDLPLQRKIGGMLSVYNALIENNRRRISLLEKMAEEIYREWFVRMRFPGCLNTKFNKGVPESWKPSTLGEVANFTMGQSPSSEYYNELGDGLPFHQGVGTYGDRFPKTVTYCSENGRKANAGDILFSVRAPVGRLNIADREMIIGRGLTAIKHKQGHNAYLFYMLKVAFADEDIIGNGSIFNSVGRDELARFAIYEPDSSLVKRFNTLARDIDSQIENLTRTLILLKKTRDALLPRLISGKLAVESLDIHFPPGMLAPESALSSTA